MLSRRRAEKRHCSKSLHSTAFSPTTWRSKGDLNLNATMSAIAAPMFLGLSFLLQHFLSPTSSFFILSQHFISLCVHYPLTFYPTLSVLYPLYFVLLLLLPLLFFFLFGQRLFKKACVQPTQNVTRSRRYIVYSKKKPREGRGKSYEDMQQVLNASFSLSCSSSSSVSHSRMNSYE